MLGMGMARCWGASLFLFRRARKELSRMQRRGTHNNRFQFARYARRTAAPLRCASAAEASR